MGPVQLVVSGVLTLLVYTMVLFAIYRIFQISADVKEIKALLLKGAKPNTAEASPSMSSQPMSSQTHVQRPSSPVPPLSSPPPSPEALVRAVHAASYEELTADLDK